MIEGGQGLVESLHSVDILARLHHRIDLMNFIFSDEVSNGRVRNQNLHRQSSTAAVSLGKQRLTKNSFERQRQLRAHLRLLRRRKHVDNTVNRRDRGISVESRKSQVTSFGDPQSRFDRFEVTHFADKY